MSPCAVRIHKEIYSLLRHPPPDFICRPKFDDFSFEIILNGAPNSCYASGSFVLELVVPKQYPFESPKLQFMTPVYHPNIDISGRICLDLLSGNWRPSNTLHHLLEAVKCLMYHPNIEDPLIPERAFQYKYDYEEFQLKAKEWTQSFAPKIDLNALKPPMDYNRKRQFEQDEVTYGSRKKYFHY